MALFEWVRWQCRAEDLAACCPSAAEEEKLTVAVVQSLEGGAGVFPQDPTPPPATPAEQLQVGEFPLEPCSTLNALKVPAEFAAVRALARAPGEQHENLQGLIQGFTRLLLRGVYLNILLDDGRALPCGAALDSDLTHLVLQASDMQHPVALSSIDDLCAPSVVYLAKGMTVPLPVPDDCCITVVVRGGNFVTLLFEDAGVREYFEFCLKVVLLAVNRPSSLSPPLLVPSERPLPASSEPEELGTMDDADPRQVSTCNSARGNSLEKV